MRQTNIIVLILLLLCSLVVLSADNPSLLSKSPITPGAELESLLAANNIKQLSIIGAADNKSIEYRLSGDMNEKLISIPKTIKTRFSQRPITEKEVQAILTKALEKKLKERQPASKTAAPDSEKIDIVIKQK